MKSIISIMLVSFIFIGCSKKSSQNYFSLAGKSTANKNYIAAIKNYNLILKEFPNSKEAPESLMKLALLYQNKRIPNISVDSAMTKCAKYYKQVFDKYPNSKDASRALFMSAFIYANALNKYDEAKSIYKLFIIKYPKNELVTSAKEEIKNLGIPPDKIIQDNTKKSS
ncbi:MAG: tetratricopeptide repeat protein [Bacteroidetes bacterium]|nr:tetratricopeptide repeat protein [Bacteroidota bacterium]MCH8169933.1 tetratricopeptide repeat protein [Bacteroidota bacterium]MCH8941712.1 tetratricopeptide repeat protein [Bacteroidota bacterium]